MPRRSISITETRRRHRSHSPRYGRRREVQPRHPHAGGRQNGSAGAPTKKQLAANVGAVSVCTLPIQNFVTHPRNGRGDPAYLIPNGQTD